MTVFGSHIPLDYLMCGAIGFLAAWLMALMVLSAVHDRAVRLTRRHFAATPPTPRQIRAERDQLRAGFAVATCKMQLDMDKLRKKIAAQATEIVRKTRLAERLGDELEAATAALAESRMREHSARAELEEARFEAVAQSAALDDAEHQLAVMKARVACIVQDLRRGVPPAAIPPNVVPLAPPPHSHDDGIMRAWTGIGTARLEDRRRTCADRR